jgi:carbonic anhydrase
MKTRILTSSILIYLLIGVSCQNHSDDNKESNAIPGDTSKVDKQIAESKQANEVKSEAPDASTKTEPGYALPRFDNGLAQSPINILTANTEKETNHKLEIAFNDEINGIENLGHTIQLDFAGGNLFTVNGKTYKFKQLHFHTPSEHLIDGMTFPIEMHVVSVSEDPKDSTKPEYLVVGMLFKMGQENKFMKEFLNAIPQQENKKVELSPGAVKLKDMFAGVTKNDLEAYYHYKGSLTTPPYTETVDWIVRKYIFEASPEQVAAIEKMEGDNARHVHALYNRKIASE